MPRRRYYRRPVRVVAAKKKWATNIIQKDFAYPTVSELLVENSAQNASPTPVVLKVGNFKIRGDGTATASGAVNVFLLYLPESWGTTETDLNSVVLSHPEWIMGWTTLNINRNSSSSGSEINNFSISTRLKRNLNSGDKVLLFIQPIGNSINFNIAFTCQFWTCAN